MARVGHTVAFVGNAHDIDLPFTGVTLHTIQRRGRLGRLTLGSLEAVRLALTTNPEIVHLHDPELTWSIIPLRLKGIKVVYDAHEDLPQQVLSKEYLNRWMRPLGSWAAHVIVKLASASDIIVAATETIATRFPSDKTVVVRNFPILRASDAETSMKYRTNAVGYVGVMGATRGTKEMVEAFAHPDFPSTWKAIIAGIGSPENFLGTLRLSDGWNKVDYRGFVSADDARDLLKECKVGIVTLRRTPAYLDSLPTKMFEYFAAGIPAVASDFPLWRSIIEEYDCGILVNEESPEEIARAVGRYAEDPELLTRHSHNARKAALGDLNWNREEKVMLAAYERLAQIPEPR
ncbi:glycosyltransferase family 4 protein [Ornithinimicrobium cryptoxanthini]|uniref:D-inositol 3-phosphate glycosyltransferase n=1 Tax=Ornithinimicrobium cryptoxanthini TaxID=2934161 RepID=A0ABY4YH59_9MICO|nr:glycosyltransferase family 4 protein [Ornithinimicrobium cryptoxanthini]USQ76096.1 glycosyltransferase family 4 protein [Ornithinimicrobium cryptoxanthini]